jgi:hypothetical protein
MLHERRGKNKSVYENNVLSATIMDMDYNVPPQFIGVFGNPKKKDSDMCSPV